MAPPKKRRATSGDYGSDDGFVADVPSSKKAKSKASDFRSSRRKSADKEVVGGGAVDAEGVTYWVLSGKRRVTISEFKGKQMVSIREYYEKDGRDLPGNKVSFLILEVSGVLEMQLPS
jgi:hypothetical protein